MESGDGGAVHVMVRNYGENPMEFGREDGICGVKLVDRTEIRAAGEATEEMRSGLAPECSALFAQYELESKAEASGILPNDVELLKVSTSRTRQEPTLGHCCCCCCLAPGARVFATRGLRDRKALANSVGVKKSFSQIEAEEKKLWPFQNGHSK